MSKQSNAMPPKGEGIGIGKMVSRLNLKAIERKAYAAYHRDGLDEIGGGILIVNGSFSELMQAHGNGQSVNILFIFLIVFAWAIARDGITIPRIGFIKPSARRQARSNLLAGAVVAIMLTMILYAVLAHIYAGLKQTSGNIAHIIHPLDIALVPLLCALAAGWLTANPRWFAYTVLLLGCVAAAWKLHFNPYWGLLVAGLLILACGVFYLVRFIRNNPIIEADISGDSSHADDTSGGGAR